MQTSCSSKCRLLMVAFPIHWQLWGLLLTVSLSILVHLRWLQSVLQLLQDAQVEVMEGKQNVSTSEQTFAAASWYLLTRLWKSLCWSVTLFSTPCCTMSGRDLSLSLHTLTDFDQLWPTLSDFDQGTRVDRRLWHHALPIGDGKSRTHTSQGRQPLQRRQESSSLRNQRLNDNKSTKLVQTSSIEQCWAASPKMSKDFVSSVFEGFL